MLGSLILVLALCTDAFVASLAYGANRVHVAWGKVLLLNGICSGCLALALGMGSIIQTLIPAELTRVVCFVSLFFLGFVKFLDYGIKAYINRRCRLRRDLSFSLSGLKVIVSIYADPMAADADGSQSLGWRETVFLALAMSIDSLAAGTMAAFLEIPTAATLILSLAVGVCMMYAGLWMGKKAAAKWNCDLSWVSGVLLMALAVMKIMN
ncbi:MAG: manganese efflux pump [Clostridium sp.]|nr:manganese efflux pump [Clostridium sp.]